MPLEVREAIMKSLPDLPSLNSLIRSCSTFRDTFGQARPVIASCVLSHQLGPALLPEAVAVLESSRIETWSPDVLSTFVEKHLHTRKSSQPSWSLEDVNYMATLHRRINFFTDDFAAKSKLRIFGKPTNPTELERARFQRSFYRFELYCNIFCNYRRPVFSSQVQQTCFFAKFSPVENEQLASARDYLFRAIAPGKMHHPGP
jgi:hypothetical protein